MAGSLCGRYVPSSTGRLRAATRERFRSALGGGV
jgi:hypothetical protein